MSDSPQTVWQPTPDDIAGSNVNALMQRPGMDSYDALLAYSNVEPAAYWKTVLDFFGVVWDTDYRTYLDQSAGLEFPKWFVGGRLSSVKSILRWADHSETSARPAVIAEREDGSVERVTFAELAQRVSSFAAGLRANGVRRGDRVGPLMEKTASKRRLRCSQSR